MIIINIYHNAMMKITFLDCTLRDGGYYNNWDFSVDLINKYFEAVVSVGVDFAEIGFRSLINNGYKGPCAFSVEDFIERLSLPKKLKLAVMVNSSELFKSSPLDKTLDKLFPVPSNESSVDLVRIACHATEFSSVLPAALFLKEKGYKIAFNLMQIAECSRDILSELMMQANDFPVDVIYFADSMGSMKPEDIHSIYSTITSIWHGPIGIHTHNNLGLALANTLKALELGVTWVDSTITGMGRGPGNALTEELSIEIAERRSTRINLVPLLRLINTSFNVMKQEYNWGPNAYYYLSGKHRIHPSYVQKMTSDTRFSEEDILSVIESLKSKEANTFTNTTLSVARNVYSREAVGTWSPVSILEGKNVLLLGTGPGVAKHRVQLEIFIKKTKPIVFALNTQSSIDPSLIDFRVACHPVRLLADYEMHLSLSQPLISPLSMLPQDIISLFSEKNILDFGMVVEENNFEFHSQYCKVPTPLVMAYSFSVVASGQANCLYLAGFDGYSADDPRNAEMNLVAKQFQSKSSLPLVSLTPSRYDIPKISVYGCLQ